MHFYVNKSMSQKRCIRIRLAWTGDDLNRERNRLDTSNHACTNAPEWENCFLHLSQNYPITDGEQNFETSEKPRCSEGSPACLSSDFSFWPFASSQFSRVSWYSLKREQDMDKSFWILCPIFFESPITLTHSFITVCDVDFIEATFNACD